MSALVETECPRCRRSVETDALACGLCGTLLRRERPMPTSTPDSTQVIVTTSTPTQAEIADKYEPWIFLAIGLATAPLLASTPILQYMGWFIASLVHEMGHAAMAWLCGMPAIPAISPAGHAAAVHAEQQPLLVAMIGCGLAWAAWRFLNGPWRFVAIALAAVLYPLLAFTHAKDFFHLVAGHGTELTFAALCLWKTLDGGFTSSRLERALYGTLGWFLLGRNVHLCLGLMRNASARAEYHSNGSFGFTNDYIRVAEDVLSWRLESVALLMLLAALLVVPAAIGFWRYTLAVPRA
ncbi:MAG: hypothetical protein JNL28_13835 [Planctomycetes bacterium]|nr:hypothetical protein [Planctomycetota bacterium]